MRRSLPSFGTSGGRLAVSAIFVAVALAAAALFIFWFRPGDPLEIEAVQDGLEHPWDIAFTDDGRMLVTERAGHIRVFGGPEAGAPLLHTASVPDVRAELESGLMGIAVDGQTVFVCATRGDDPEGPDAWRVDVLRSSLATDGSLAPFEPLTIAPAQGAPRHQGCAVEIGPDGHLWLTIGDANQPAGANRAQDPTSLNGKVVRLTVDGAVPADAPFASGAYSIGHRNPQGIAFGADGSVYAVEHGTDVNDEINVIRPGANYGYPCITGADDPGPIPDACDAGRRTDPAGMGLGRPDVGDIGRRGASGLGLGRVGRQPHRHDLEGGGPASLRARRRPIASRWSPAPRPPLRPAARGNHRTRWRALRLDGEWHGRPHPPHHPPRSGRHGSSDNRWLRTLSS